MRKAIKDLKEKYFSREIDFRARLFNVLALSGAGISMVTMI